MGYKLFDLRCECGRELIDELIWNYEDIICDVCGKTMIRQPSIPNVIVDDTPKGMAKKEIRDWKKDGWDDSRSNEAVDG